MNVIKVVKLAKELEELRIRKRDIEERIEEIETALTTD